MKFNWTRCEIDKIRKILNETEGLNYLSVKDTNFMLDKICEALTVDEKKNGWIPVSETLPIAEPVYTSSFNNKYESQKVLVQTKRGEVFAAKYVKQVYINKAFKDEETWYTYGTGGRQMRVMSKVIAWMPLPKNI